MLVEPLMFYSNNPYAGDGIVRYISKVIAGITTAVMRDNRKE